MHLLLLPPLLAFPAAAQSEALAPASGGAEEAVLPDEIHLSPGFVELNDALSALSGFAPATRKVRPADVLVPIGRWVAVADQAGWTYLDSEAGPSVQLVVPSARVMVTEVGASDVHLIGRLAWRGSAFRELTPSEIAARGLPDVPDWVASYGPQPRPGTLWGAWRLDRNLWGRSLPEWPDDVEVLFDDDPPAPTGWESMWVHVTACAGPRCTGILINEPFHLVSVKVGDTVTFSRRSVNPDEYLLPWGVNAPRVPRRPMSADGP